MCFLHALSRLRGAAVASAIGARWTGDCVARRFFRSVEHSGRACAAFSFIAFDCRLFCGAVQRKRIAASKVFLFAVFCARLRRTVATKRRAIIARFAKFCLNNLVAANRTLEIAQRRLTQSFFERENKRHIGADVAVGVFAVVRKILFAFAQLHVFAIFVFVIAALEILVFALARAAARRIGVRCYVVIFAIVALFAIVNHAVAAFRRTNAFAARALAVVRQTCIIVAVWRLDAAAVFTLYVAIHSIVIQTVVIVVALIAWWRRRRASFARFRAIVLADANGVLFRFARPTRVIATVTALAAADKFAFVTHTLAAIRADALPFALIAVFVIWQIGRAAFGVHCRRQNIQSFLCVRAVATRRRGDRTRTARGFETAFKFDRSAENKLNDTLVVFHRSLQTAI